ncbi:MAG TPA: TolC family protein [Stellaceae bacterium]|nr:TolC family protein [Stellaceae bacterium]
MPRQLSRSPPAPLVTSTLALLAILLVAAPACAEAPVALQAPGATLDEVLAIARRLSPELGARALDTEAAQARVAIAGSLADPTLRVTSDEIDRTGGPRQNKMLFTVEQEFPLWGKLDLRRDQANADVARSRADTRVTEAELIEKVKVAFAQYYQSDQAIRTTEDLHRVVHDMARVARDRYAQGRGSQQEVYKAEVEITRLATDIVRLETRRRSAAARLNALLGRPIDAPLARPVKLRALPSAAALAPDALMQRARAGNPSLAGRDAQIAAAAAGKQLADKNWYPDVMLKAGAIDRTGNGPNGYLAEIGLRVPLRWSLHEAQQREAAAQVGAAQARRQAQELQIQGELGEFTADLAGSRKTADLIRTQLLPQSQALLRSGVAGYGLGRAELVDVLRAEHDLANLRIELLSAEFDQQRQLAAIERLIGGDL